MTSNLDENIILQNEFINLYKVLELLKNDVINTNEQVYKKNIDTYNNLIKIKNENDIYIKSMNINRKDYINDLHMTYNDIKNNNNKIEEISDNINKLLDNSEFNTYYSKNIKLCTDNIEKENIKFINFKNNIKFYKKQYIEKEKNCKELDNTLIHLKHKLKEMCKLNDIESEKFYKTRNSYNNQIEIHKEKTNELHKINKEKVVIYENYMNSIRNKQNEINRQKILHNNLQSEHNILLNKNKNILHTIKEKENEIELIEKKIMEIKTEVEKTQTNIKILSNSDKEIDKKLKEKR